ncbi:MAG: hypothetical protein ACTSWQ_11350 [Candidatus Thorarchaeota archaeon]
MGKVGQYHLRTKFKDSYKLIRHIRYLINEKVLNKLSHEGTEDGDTYVCIMLKTRISLERFNRIEKHLNEMGLKMI